MAYDFIPMRVVVKGEESGDHGFLPRGNYITINGVDSPLKHCCTLEMPFGQYEVMIHVPAPLQAYRVAVDVSENQLYTVTLVLNSSRNIVDASFGCETVTEDPLGIYENDFKSVIKHRSEVEAWRNRPAPSSSSSGADIGGCANKTIGCGLVILLLFGFAVFACYSGLMEIEREVISENFTMTNVGVYIVMAIIGLVVFVAGLIFKKLDD